MVAPALRWVLAFLNGHSGAIIRRYRVSSYLGVSSHVCIMLDASPWGLGGIIMVDSVILEYFADSFTDFDVAMFGHCLGSPDGQQTWEALAMLASLRAWASIWQDERTVLEVRGDNVAMLTMASTRRAKGKGTNAIARELVLDLANGLFRPSICRHIPGTNNIFLTY
jgi:hypothetical protein